MRLVSRQMGQDLKITRPCLQQTQHMNLEVGVPERVLGEGSPPGATQPALRPWRPGPIHSSLTLPSLHSWGGTPDGLGGSRRKRARARAEGTAEASLWPLTFCSPGGTLAHGPPTPPALTALPASP